MKGQNNVLDKEELYPSKTEQPTKGEKSFSACLLLISH